MAKTDADIMVVVGTRPEAIKLGLLVRKLKAARGAGRVVLCSTGQHREMLRQTLETFDLAPDVELDLMRPDQTLAGLTSRLFAALDGVLHDVEPKWVVVQGDTTSAMVGAVTAFYRRVRVAHVEAGLRTYDLQAPFPEEFNRSVVGIVADLHFPPTAGAAEALRRAGVPGDRIIVTGNTVVDALLWVCERLRTSSLPAGLDGMAERIAGRRMVLVTGHRRESFGRGFENICLALKDIVSEHGDVSIVYPVHLNPKVREPVMRILGHVERVHLIEPLGYQAFVWLMDHSTLILTDSGGVQEEAPSLGKPVLIMRDTTERPEAVEAGVARLVGNDRASIVAAVRELLTCPAVYRRMASPVSPFGDGKASDRITAALLERLG